MQIIVSLMKEIFKSQIKINFKHNHLFYKQYHTNREFLLFKATIF
jgi:hypothetical protein